MVALDTHSVYTAEINKVTINQRDSGHYDTSNLVPCVERLYTPLTNVDLLKKYCIHFLLCKKWLDQLQTDRSTA